MLDNRDVDKYYENSKFESFVHLKQTTVKIIVNATVDTILYLDMADLWSANSWTPGTPRVNGYTMRVKEGINIICLCHMWDTEE